MFKSKKREACKCPTPGAVIYFEPLHPMFVDDSGSHYARVVKVEYFVDGRRYVIKEDCSGPMGTMRRTEYADKKLFGLIRLRLKSKKDRRIEVGSTVCVMYQEGNPGNAYILDNDARW